MLKSLTTVNVWVQDQDEALAFYTEKLGLELRNDTTVPEMGNFRWLTVGVPGQDVAIVLMAVPGPPVFDEETSSKLKDLVATGAAGGLFVATEGRDGT
jgi:catechol 2,3-dioxygenase-like lactoylglutathione lyase family enzyme